MSLAAHYQFPTQAILDANKKVVESPKLLQRALKRRESRLRGLTLKIVAVYPGAPHYPIRWKSDKQRRAFFATDGFGGGIPHQRTGGLLEAYDARFRFTADDGAFVVSNDYEGADYIIGDEMQPFHLDTGYEYLPDVVDREIVPLVLNDYEVTWNSINNPFTRA